MIKPLIPQMMHYESASNFSLFSISLLCLKKRDENINKVAPVEAWRKLKHSSTKQSGNTQTHTHTKNTSLQGWTPFWNKTERTLMMNGTSSVLQWHVWKDSRGSDSLHHWNTRARVRGKNKKNKCGKKRQVVPYLHEAPDVLLFLQEVLVESTPVGDQLQHLTLPEEGVFALLLAPAAGTAVGESGQGDNKGQREHWKNVWVWMWVSGWVSEWVGVCVCQ